MNEVILEFLFGTGEYQQAIPPLAIAGIAQGVSALVGAFSAGRQKRRARNAKIQAERKLANLEANRQAIIDPYAGITDLSSMITNPFENLQVATQAAEMQAEQTDMALASTLDTLRATGRSAGGATALARAAAESKQGISARIEQQEVANAQLRAQGEQQAQQARMGEAIRQQMADVSGKAFVYGQREQREMRQLDRTQAMVSQYGAAEAQARQAQNQAIGSVIGTAASFGAQALAGNFAQAKSVVSTPASLQPQNMGSFDLGSGLSSFTSQGIDNFVSQYGGPFSAIGGSKYLNPNYSFGSD